MRFSEDWICNMFYFRIIGFQQYEIIIYLIDNQLFEIYFINNWRMNLKFPYFCIPNAKVYKNIISKLII